MAASITREPRESDRIGSQASLRHDETCRLPQGFPHTAQATGHGQGCHTHGGGHRGLESGTGV